MNTANGKARPDMTREQFLRQADELLHNALLSTRGIGWMNGFDREASRRIDEECGYPPFGVPVGVDFYKDLYERESIAARVVEVMPRETWQATPTIKDNKGDGQNPTEFEEAVAELGKALAPGGGPSWHKEVHGSPLWEKLLRLDVLSGIGQFGVMLLGIDDGKNLQDPIDGATELLTNGLMDSPMPEAGEKGYEATQELRRMARGEAVARQRWTHNEKQGEIYEPQFADVPLPPLTDDQKAVVRNWEAQRAVHNAMKRTGGAVENCSDEERSHVEHWLKLRAHVEQVRNARIAVEAEFKERVQNALAASEAAADAHGIGVGRDRAERAFNSAYANDHLAAADEHQAAANALRQHMRTPRMYTKENKRWMQERMVAPHIEAARLHRELALTRNKFVEKFADLLPGTDRQYYEAGSLGMGMAQAKGASLQGTDQQYMGIQFGPSEAPAQKPSKKKRKLLFVRIFDESLVQIVRWEWNVNNPRFGQPVMYRITLTDPRQIYSGVGLPLATVFVHWTRVIHVACPDNKQTSEVLGTPRMQQCLNRLLDLRKVPAAGAEGYWQSCFAAVSLETTPQLGGEVKLDYAGLDQMMADFYAGLRRALITSGMTAKTIAPSVVDPTPHITGAIQAICIRIACPQRVFMGSERGELASSQDDDKWNDVLRAREQLHTTPEIVCPFFDRLILIGVLPEPEDGYRVEWPDRDSLNDKDKAALALTITQAVAAFIAGNCESKIPFKAFLLKFFDGYFSQEEIDIIVDEAEKQAEKDLEEKQNLADQHDFEPVPSPGFAHPPEPVEPVEPVKPAQNEATYEEIRELVKP